MDKVRWHVCRLSVSKLMGRETFYSVEILDFDTSEPLKIFGGGYHVGYTTTLKITCSLYGVHTSCGTGDTIKSLVANVEKVFKILIFRAY